MSVCPSATGLDVAGVRPAVDLFADRLHSVLVLCWCIVAAARTRPDLVNQRKEEPMRRLRMVRGRWVTPWVLPLALMVLPNCRFDPGFVAAPPRIPPGTTLVPCDINTEEIERRCAVGMDVSNGVRLAEAAVALVQGNDGKILGLDDSPASLATCGGQPEVITFRGEFPAGLQICVDPATVGAGLQFETSSDVCVEKCLDLVNADDPPDPALVTFCQQRAHASTNVSADPNVSFANGCTAEGMPNEGFADPRREGEPVEWVNTFGVDTTGGNLTRTAPCSVTPCSGFDAGAASVGAATAGDGYLEFSVAELTTNRIGGLTSGPGADDLDPNFTTVGFGIDFFRDGCVYVYENGVPQIPSTPVPATGCVLPANTWGNYSSGDRFRITFVDNFDGTATIGYAKLPGPCTPGSECPALPFLTSGVHGAYPLHVDAGFEDQGGALLDVRLVYIH
jgi:hypothetical protein